MPTLEEYSYLLGLLVTDRVPFTSLEGEPKSHEIVALVHLGRFEVESHMTTKGGIRGLHTQFLLEKACYFSRMKSTVTFEAIFALLTYRLFLFMNIDNFVDINAIRIFFIGNPVPTILGDAYYSIHLRDSYHGGMTICSMPLLYKWLFLNCPGLMLSGMSGRNLVGLRRFWLSLIQILFGTIRITMM